MAERDAESPVTTRSPSPISSTCSTVAKTTTVDSNLPAPHSPRGLVSTDAREGHRTGSSSEILDVTSEEDHEERCRPIRKSNSWSGKATASPTLGSPASSKPSSPSSSSWHRTGKTFKRRKGVQQLITGFDHLRAKLKNYAPERNLSKIETLRMAIAYIKDMDKLLKEDEEATRTKQAARENAQMMRQLQYLMTPLPGSNCNCQGRFGQLLSPPFCAPSQLAAGVNSASFMPRASQRESCSWLDNLLANELAATACADIPVTPASSSAATFADFLGSDTLRRCANQGEFNSRLLGMQGSASQLSQSSPGIADDWMFSQFKMSDYVSECLRRAQARSEHQPCDRTPAGLRMDLQRNPSSTSLPVTSREQMVQSLLWEAEFTDTCQGEQSPCLRSSTSADSLAYLSDKQLSLSVGQESTETVGSSQLATGDSTSQLVHSSQSDLPLLASSTAEIATAADLDIVASQILDGEAEASEEEDLEFLSVLEDVVR